MDILVLILIGRVVDHSPPAQEAGLGRLDLEGQRKR